MTDKVDIDIVKYYQACLKSYENASEDNKYEEALRTVASLNKNGIKVCYHASICHIMEEFVKEYPTPEIVGCLFRSINNYLEGVIVGKNTSRLLEKVLLSCKSDEIAQDEVVQFQSRKFCEYMWNHYPDNLENNIGSHIVRLFFQFACGVYVSTQDKVYSSKSVVISTPMEDNYLEKLHDLIKRFLMNSHINQLLTNEYMSSTLQIILVICSVRCPEKFKDVTKHLMAVLCDIDQKISKKNLDDIKIPDSFQDKYQSFFIECLILILPESKDFKRFAKKYLKLGKEKFICTILTNSDSCGLFKAAIMRTSATDILLEVAQQIRITLYDTSGFECGNVFLKLLVELVNKIASFPENDQSFIRSYKNAIIEIVQFLSKNEAGKMSMLTFLTNGIKKHSAENDITEIDCITDEREPICSLWSSLLMQSILQSFKPIPQSINKMFTEICSEELLLLGKDSKASRAIEAFIKSINVLDEVKIRFLNILSSENLLHLSCSPCGSRIMDSIWDSGNTKLIDLTKTKLESKRSDLKSHIIGRFIEAKFFCFSPKRKKENIQNNNGDKNKLNKQQLDLKRRLNESVRIEPKNKKSKK